MDSAKLARRLNTALASVEEGSKEGEEGSKEEQQERSLDVFLQVNTSGEDAKSGLDPSSDAILELALTIRRECPHLRFKGLMTIGMRGDESDFITLRELRDEVTRRWAEEQEETEGPLASPLELSMGMSGDYEAAIAQV